MREQNHQRTRRGFDERGPLHTCLLCSCPYVYLVDTRSMGMEGRPALLRCPNCGVHRAGVFTLGALEALERRRQRGEEALRSRLQRLENKDRLAEIERFAAALAADAILPEDFRVS
jgi:hypothetical protein